MAESMVPEAILDPTMKKIVPISPITIGATVDPAGYSADAYIYELTQKQNLKDAQAHDAADKIPENETPEEKKKREGAARHKSKHAKPKVNLRKSKVINGINTKIKAEIPRTSNIDFIMGKKTKNNVVMQGIDLNRIKKTFGSPLTAIKIMGSENKKNIVGIDINRTKKCIQVPKINLNMIRKRKIKVK